MSVLERGQCPECLLTVAIKKDGTLYTHMAATSRDGRPYSENKCPGAGGWPRTKRPLWR